MIYLMKIVSRNKQLETNQMSIVNSGCHFASLKKHSNIKLGYSHRDLMSIEKQRLYITVYHR